MPNASENVEASIDLDVTIEMPCGREKGAGGCDYDHEAQTCECMTDDSSD